MKGELTHFGEVKAIRVLVEIQRENEITLEDHVRETCESPPAHKQSINS